MKVREKSSLYEEFVTVNVLMLGSDVCRHWFLSKPNKHEVCLVKAIVLFIVIEARGCLWSPGVNFGKSDD